MATLEGHYRDLCDIEFTIERGKLWMLQTRVGKRTAAAAFVIATQLVDEGVIDLDEALTRVTGAQLAQLMFPTFDTSGHPEQIAKGIAGLAGRRRRQGRLHRRARGRRGGKRREGHPGTPGDEPRRPARHDRGAGHPDQPWRQDVARRRGRPWHGQDLRVRRRRPDRRPDRSEVHGRRPDRRRRRRDLDRRYVRPGLPRRGAGTAVAGRAVLRGHGRRRTSSAVVASVDRIIRHADDRSAARRTHERRQRRGFRARTAVRRRGHRALPDRAHVPRRPSRTGRAADSRATSRTSGRRRSTRCCRCSGPTSWRSSRRCPGCRSRFG